MYIYSYNSYICICIKMCTICINVIQLWSVNMRWKYQAVNCSTKQRDYKPHVVANFWPSKWLPKLNLEVSWFITLPGISATSIMTYHDSIMTATPTCHVTLGQPIGLLQAAANMCCRPLPPSPRTLQEPLEVHPEAEEEETAAVDIMWMLCPSILLNHGRPKATPW